jgi:hypothetical protein
MGCCGMWMAIILLLKLSGEVSAVGETAADLGQTARPAYAYTSGKYLSTSEHVSGTNGPELGSAEKCRPQVRHSPHIFPCKDSVYRAT